MDECEADQAEWMAEHHARARGGGREGGGRGESPASSSSGRPRSRGEEGGVDRRKPIPQRHASRRHSISERDHGRRYYDDNGASAADQDVGVVVVNGYHDNGDVVA